MKLRFLLGVVVAGSVSISAALHAQTPAAAPATADATAEQAIAAELTPLVERVKAKLGSGQATAEQLQPELKEFDALIAKHAGEKTEMAAMISLLKARIYLEGLGDKATGVALLKALKKDFPDTQLAQQVDPYIQNLEAEAAAEARLAVGKEFPPFEEKDLAGAALNLAAYKGKVVLVDFWATWCGPCVAELPNVIAAYRKYHDKGFEIVGVSLDKDRGALTRFLAENKMEWPQFFDGKGWENKVAAAYAIHAIPATFLLDGEGKIVGKGLRGEALAAKVGELLGAK